MSPSHTTDDLYCSTGEFIFIRYKGTYYQRLIGIGWRVVSASKLPDSLNWSIPQPRQIAAYESDLPK